MSGLGGVTRDLCAESMMGSNLQSEYLLQECVHLSGCGLLNPIPAIFLWDTVTSLPALLETHRHILVPPDQARAPLWRRCRRDQPTGSRQAIYRGQNQRAHFMSELGSDRVTLKHAAFDLGLLSTSAPAL